MVSFLCATPYHILVSLYIMAGEFPDEQADLYLLDHFAITEDFLTALRESGFYRDIHVIHSDYKTKAGNIGRLVRAFFPSRTMRQAFASREYSTVFFGALDYVNMARWKRAATRRGSECRLCLMEDGIGTYINPQTYIPKKYSAVILRILGLRGDYESIRELWCFKPQYRIENRQYDCHAICRNAQAEQRVQNAIEKLWPVERLDIPENAILYLEQPYLQDDNNEMVHKEQQLLRDISEQTGRPVYVKFHPRSVRQHLWTDFPCLDVAVPFEAIMSRVELKNVDYISTISTAIVSPLIINADPVGGFFVQKILDFPEFRVHEKGLEALIGVIAQNGGRITMPLSLQELLPQIAGQ